MKKNLLEKYEEWMEFCGMKYNAVVWIALSIVIGLVVGFVSLILGGIILKEPTLIPVAFGMAIMVLLLGLPYMKKESIVANIEKNFSDALKQMADTLKAGDTYESALREVANSDYGRLSEEMALSLRRLEEGENIEMALRVFSDRIDSRLIKRTIVIIIDSIKSGSSLAEILEEIADDVRDLHKLKQERIANTTMQFLFMVAAGGIIAPMIFGEVNAVMGVFAKVTIQAISVNEAAVAMQTTNFIFMLIQGYIIIAVVGSGLMMSVIRQGKFNKSIIYIPILLLVAFLVYYGTKIVIGTMLAGSL